jgi:hypothetical protein
LAAEKATSGKIKRFGFITTNSITQSFNRKVLEKYLAKSSKPISIIFAIPDHPWVDNKEGAAVRVAMTGVKQGNLVGKICCIKNEIYENDIAKIELAEKLGLIHADLTIGANVLSMTPLKSNFRMSFQGVIPLGNGFRLFELNLNSLGLDINNLPEVVKPYMIGRDLVQTYKQKWVIDFFGLSVEEARQKYPKLYQIVLEQVKPMRDQNNRKTRRENWWLFGENAPKLRDALSGLSRFIVTPDTSKFKPFVFVDGNLLPDVQLYSVVSSDAWILGVLESSIHKKWLQKIAPRMGKGNDLRWKPAIVFDPFPFPDPTQAQKQKIRELGERLDAHRKQVQANHPDITITGMYNLLEKLRAGEPFTDKDRDYNQKALVSTLKQIHDDLDRAVFAAYGWDDLIPLWEQSQNNNAKEDLENQILDRLVALNAERAEEERNGLIRWLRPEYQAPEEQVHEPTLEGVIPEAETVVEPVEQQKWPTKPKDQLTAIRDLLRSTPGEWTVNQIAAQFKGRTTQKKLDAITENLERLEWFGLVISHTKNGITSWQYTELQQVS